MLECGPWPTYAATTPPLNISTNLAYTGDPQAEGPILSGSLVRQQTVGLASLGMHTGASNRSGTDPNGPQNPAVLLLQESWHSYCVGLISSVFGNWTLGLGDLPRAEKEQVLCHRPSLKRAFSWRKLFGALSYEDAALFVVIPTCAVAATSSELGKRSVGNTAHQDLQRHKT